MIREQTAASPSPAFAIGQTLGLLGWPNVTLQSRHQLNSEISVCAFPLSTLFLFWWFVFLLSFMA